jgi:hypothetical protein
MRRSIISLMAGILCGALLSAAVSVYLFHDVDQDQIEHWNEAFLGLCAESVVFTLIIGGAVGLLALLGRRIFNLKDCAPRASLGLILGVGVTILQYAWDFAGRKLVPEHADISLFLYLVVAIVLCTIVLLRDGSATKTPADVPTPR